MRAIEDVYLTNETYAALRAELTRLIELPDVHDADTKVVSALGEVAGIWPESIKN